MGGFPHPDHLLRALTAQQAAEWEAFMDKELIGDERADLRASYLTAMFFNANKKKNAIDKKPIDFMPFVERPQQSVDMMKRICMGIEEHYNRKR